MTHPLRSAAALVVVPALALAACGDDGATGAKPDLPSETPALWNPCDALDAAFIKKHFGATVTEDDGTPTSPDCRFAPEESSGEPVVQANYQQYGGTLDELWKQMGQPEKADVREPEIEGADAARIVVSVVEKQLYVTGFVQTGFLYQVVNVVDPAPFDEERDVRGVTATLTALAEHADAKGAGRASASPTG